MGTRQGDALPRRSAGSRYGIPRCPHGRRDASGIPLDGFRAIYSGVVKELLDERFEWKDLLATAIGGAAVTVGLIILYVV